MKNDFTWLWIPLLGFLYILLFTVNQIVGAWTIPTDVNYNFLRYPAAILGVDLFRWGVFRRLYYACTGLVKIFLTWVMRSKKSIFVNCKLLIFVYRYLRCYFVNRRVLLNTKCWMIKRSILDDCSFPSNSKRTTVTIKFDEAKGLLNDRSKSSKTSWMFI